ncbi:MAG: ribulose-phosphate 3-epimerase [Candidatus Omnitrophica bacterium]|nr:ribulose-phosphate 3-epimerase [Candidatus Omnitrophota bacterium]
MPKNILIAPSILSADFAKLKEEIKKIEASGADLIHIDVMDGHFVPNVTIGPPVVKAIKKCSRLPLDVHLMIESPHKFIKEFSDAGSDIITIHAEAYGSGPKGQNSDIKKGSSLAVSEIDESRVKEVLNKIKALGRKCGLSLNPDTPFCVKNVLSEIDMILIMSVHPGFGGQEFISGVIPKIKEARRFYKGDIEVDGGINDENVRSVIDAGANIIVAGSYFFSAKDPKEAVRKLRIE